MSLINDEINKNEKYAGLFNSTYGQIALASFFIAAISGVLLAISFNITTPFDSLSLIILANPAANIFRYIHYWSAQFFLVFTLLHLWDHFRLNTEKNVKKGIWLRLTISLIAVFYVMLSGFIIKGDTDSIQAKNILTSLLGKIPFFGEYLAYSFLGPEKDFQIPYVQHIATATIFLWLITIEHSKILWPKLRLVLFLIPIFLVAGFIFPPSLHDNMNGIVKGPWYFLGLQEFLHYLTYPVISIIVVAALLILIYFVPSVNENRAKLFKNIILVTTIFYFILLLVGLFFRGEDWEFKMPWNHKLTNEIKINTDFNFSTISIEKLKQKKIPVILGRREGCMFCHDKTEGFSPAHNPEAIGCASCHKGNIFTLSKNSAHKGMILIPGNLTDAKETCGNSQCHPDIPGRVDNAIMTTLTGIVSVDHFTFNESKNLNKFNRITDIDHSPADNHLRNLCASCHIGNMKKDIGPISELSRGGGCNACHLNYDKDALENIGALKPNKFTDTDSLNKFIHPNLTINISSEHCFGCHSRSGRISTNYEGWSETELENFPPNNKSDYKVLEDGRIFKKEVADIHFEKGMTCIDCHSAKEVMGDGNIYLHKEQQVKIQCVDCHTKTKPETVEAKNIDSESQKIVTLRKYNLKGRNFIVTREDRHTLTNTYLDSTNNIHLITKNSGIDLVSKPPLAVCTEVKAHKRLSCNSCHTSWVSQCINCHTDFKPGAEVFDNLENKEVKGGWVETASDFRVDEPTLGIKIIKGKDGSEKEVIDNFVPGMIIHITDGNRKIFKRLFAPASPHTIRRESRSCESCHNDPLALGYGRGKLYFTKEGKWNFKPEYKPLKKDSLPEDAWIGFLQNPKGDFATRTNVRPFTIDEQKKILTVGACLTCHKSNSNVINSYLDTGRMPHLSNKCIKPKWN